MWIKIKKDEIMEPINKTTSDGDYVPRLDDDFYD